jgi:hypothetical protein
MASKYLEPMKEDFTFACFNSDCEADRTITLIYEGEGEWYVPDVVCNKCDHALSSAQMKYLSAAMNYKHSQQSK